MKNKTLFLLLGLFITGCYENSSSSEFDYTIYDYENENAQTYLNYLDGSVIDYSTLEVEDKTLILALLENYLYSNHLSGITLYDDSGLVKISDRIKIPTKTLSSGKKECVVDYGFGIISEGSILYELPNSDYPNYYHLYESKDPNSFSFYENKGTIIDKYLEYISSSYFNKKLSKSKNQFEYYPSLASNINIINDEYLPLPLDENNNVVYNDVNSNKYRIYLRDNLVYNTLSNHNLISKYKNRNIDINDYLTPYKYLYNKAYNLKAIDNNLLNNIRGLKEYYDSGNLDLFDNVGIKINKENNYIEFTFLNSFNPYEVRNMLSNPLYAPIPEQFIGEINGINNYGKYFADFTPVDTTLSTGPYVLQEHNSNNYFCFTKNKLIETSVLGGTKRYLIPGIYVSILKEASFNANAAYNAYNNKQIDYVIVPSNKYEDEFDKDDTYASSSNMITKLNINQCDEKTWKQLFGINGTISSNKIEEYWNIEPALSNQNFLKGLNYCINRKDLSLKRGKNPTVDFIPDTCLLSKEGKSYNNTLEHYESLLMYYDFNEQLINEYGYDFNTSSQYFKIACEELLANNLYKENDSIILDIAWPSKSNVETIGTFIENNIIDAFNNSNSKLNIKINHIVCNSKDEMIKDVVYKGKYDLAFGDYVYDGSAIEKYFERYTSQNTLNHGINTNLSTNNNLIELLGSSYTYDALLSSIQKPTYILQDGSKAITCDAILLSNKINLKDKSRDIVIKYDVVDIKDENNNQLLTTNIESIKICNTTKEYEIKDYIIDNNQKTISINITGEMMEIYNGNVKIKIEFSETISDSNVSYISKDIVTNIPFLN